jgi:hypothetical protein
MVVDLIGITLYFIKDVDLPRADYKHLRAVSEACSEVNWWHTIMALARVLPTARKEPGDWA